MSHVISIRAVLSVMVVIAVGMLSSPAWSQHGHGGGGHGGGGHGGGYGGHGGGGGHGYGGHYGGGHGHGGYGYGGHGIVGHYGGGHGYGVHGGLHGHADYGYGHYGYGHDYGLHGYGHGGYLHGYGYHDYYPHSSYLHYPDYYDYPYYHWYPSYSASLYPWYGFYDADDVINRVVVNRPVIAGEEAENEHAHEHAAEPESAAPESTAPPRSTVTAQGRQYQQRAESAFRGGRFGEALRLANHALVEMPRDGELLLFVSHGLFATGDYRGAAAAIHQASTTLDKSDWGYVVKNWRSYYRGAAYREAMDKLNTFVKENPDAAYARFLRAYHFGFLGQEEFALKEMAKAIELESRDQLAIELLTMFGGQPPTDVSDAANNDRTSEADPIEEERDHETEHDHDSHEHGGRD